CSTCAQTFWPRGSFVAPYNFFDFDDRVREVKRYFEKRKDPGPLRELFVSKDPIRLGMIDANITITADEYLRIDRIEDGLTLIKSPKGTGKTERLRSLLRGDDSTLLIGHRVALIRQSCERLGLKCYLDFDGPLDGQRRLGVCLDSLQTLQSGGILQQFDTIIIDESEQVLSHFLSDTMARENRHAIFVIFRTLLHRAKRVIALDADLGWLTFETLTKLVNDDTLSKRKGKAARKKKPARTHRAFMHDYKQRLGIISKRKGKAAHEKKPTRTHIYLNERATKRDIEVFRYEYELQGDLKRSLADKKRIFVTSNSKKRIEAISESVDEEFKRDVRQIKITLATVNSD